MSVEDGVYFMHVVITNAQYLSNGLIRFRLTPTTVSSEMAMNLEKCYQCKEGDDYQDFTAGKTIWKVGVDRDTNMIHSIKKAGYNCNLF